MPLLNEFLRRNTFQRQLTVLTAVSILLLSLAASFALSWQSSLQLQQTLVSQGVRVTQSLAEQSRLALLSGSAENAAGAIQATLQFPDVTAVELLDGNGKRITRRFKLADATWPAGDTPVALPHNAASDAAKLQYETDTAWCFVAPVRTDAGGASPFDASGMTELYLGQVRVVQSKETMLRTRTHLFVSNLAISIGCAVGFLFLISLLARRLTAPLAQLSASMARAEAGEREVRATPTGPQDIADMARAFNSMMSVLAERERELITARDNAMAFGQLKAQFAATVSHEIRTPLNGVVGTLDLLIASRLSPRQRHFVELAWDSAQYLLDLVNNILDFSRLDAGAVTLARKPLALRELVEGVVDTLTPQAHQKGLEIGYAVSIDTPLAVLADGRRLRQILTNLVANAVKFTESGEVAVRVNVSATLGQASSHAHCMARFEVCDSGPGVPPEFSERIFESFVQVDPSPTRQHQGSGLGLAICRQLVELMGGRIGVDPQPGRGSRFWFEVPVEPLPSPGADALVAPEHALRILVVDPSTIVREFFAASLPTMGHTVRCAGNFAEAIQHAQEKSVPAAQAFDLVLIDAYLAAGDARGLGLLRPLLPAATRWVLMTPFVQRTDTVPDYVTAILGKPLRVPRLRALLDSLNAPETAALPAPDTQQPEAAAGFRVLVVEDNRTNQTVVRSMIALLGGNAHVVASGQEAVSACEHDTWDAILMDCNMPGMDGFEATALIRLRETRSGGHMPIIAMTANVTTADVEKCLASGMDDHLPKPFTLDTLRSALRRCLPAHRISQTLERNEADLDQPESGGHYPLDANVFNRLRDALGGALGEAVTPFLEDMPQHIATMRRAISEARVAQLRQAAHVVSGAAGNLGAMNLARLARELQAHAEQSDLQTAPDIVEQLATEYQRVSLALNAALADITEPSVKPSGNSAVVLVVDDDRSTRSALRYALQLKGFHIHEAADGAAALATMERITPDVILMDAMMPGMDGFTTCARMKELPQGHDVPVLMITSLDDRQSIERAYAAGATDYITKPLHLNAVVQRVGRAIDALRTERHVRHLAYNDLLTGLPNRALFGEMLKQQIERARQTHTHVAVLFLDLDRFKFVNDTLGHEIGDLLLKSVATRLRQCVRASDQVARLGGDEFTIVLEELANPAVAANAAQKIAVSLAEPFAIDGHDIFISCSVGISLFPHDGEDVSTLLRHADTAMYQAKRTGRGYEFYEAGMEISVSEHLLLEGALRKALDREELVIHYQPEIGAANGKLVGAEALLRWYHPTRGAVSPAEFIPLAEETGMISAIGEWVLVQACKQWKAWLSATGNDMRLSINLSGKQFQGSDFAARVEQVLANTGLEPRHLVFEITESVWMEQATEGLSTLHRLKNLGVKLAIDDFGTGYSSLSYLKRLPVDILKIDRVFIRDIVTSTADKAIVQGIMALAHSLELEVIAEGVETEAQRAILAAMGCDHLQGFLFSAALDADRFSLDMLGARTA